jgi:hypothetical protein
MLKRCGLHQCVSFGFVEKTVILTISYLGGVGMHLTIGRLLQGKDKTVAGKSDQDKTRQLAGSRELNNFFFLLSFHPKFINPLATS